MDHRHRSLLAAQQYDGAAALTKDSSKLLQEPQRFAKHRAICFSNESYGPVHSFMRRITGPAAPLEQPELEHSEAGDKMEIETANL